PGRFWRPALIDWRQFDVRQLRGQYRDCFICWIEIQSWPAFRHSIKSFNRMRWSTQSWARWMRMFFGVEPRCASQKLDQAFPGSLPLSRLGGPARPARSFRNRGGAHLTPEKIEKRVTCAELKTLAVAAAPMGECMERLSGGFPFSCGW